MADKTVYVNQGSGIWGVLAFVALCILLGTWLGWISVPGWLITLAWIIMIPTIIGLIVIAVLLILLVIKALLD